METCLLTHSPVASVQLDTNGSIIAIFNSLPDAVEGLEGKQVICDCKAVNLALRHAGVNVKMEGKNSILMDWRRNRYTKLLENGLVTTYTEYKIKVREQVIIQTSKGVRENAARGDEVVAQIIHAIDDLRKSVNLTANRLTELYSLHFPELVARITNVNTLARIIIKQPVRTEITTDLLKSFAIPSSKAELIIDAADKSLGGELSRATLQPITDYASTLIQMSEKLKALEHWIDDSMDDIAPNLTAVSGANVGARLIAAMGSLKALAMKSSSKVQILGAEKALYSSIRSRGSPPKHGIIFQIPEIGNSPYWIRGRMARAFAAKIVIAARLDIFNGEFLGKRMRDELREYEVKLRKEFPNPPKNTQKGRKVKKRRGKR